MENVSSSGGAFLPTENLCRNSHTAERFHELAREMARDAELGWPNVQRWKQKLHKKPEPPAVVFLKPTDEPVCIYRLLRPGRQARLYNGGGGHEKQRDKLLH